ncbi:MAG TPA: hypothetical protein PLE67_11295, partial [Tenuifilaceae bacterium]|nr:hypothetical protein [Tenuifilaceae bacterium]
MKIFNRKISVKFYLTAFVNFAAAVTFAQTSYNGTINLDVNGFGPAQNVETTISYTENATVVFTDTIRNGAVQFTFQTTGVAGIHAPQEYFCVTNIPGYADFNIAVSAFVNPVRLDVLNVFGQKVLCLRSNSETLTSSQGFTQESNFYVNLSGQPNGIYFLVLHTASRKGLSAKVVKTGENICGPSDLYQPASPVESAKLASAAGSNFTVSYSQILSDNDLARIENTSFDVLINPETNNTFYHTATMVAYPEYETTTTGQITIGDENIIAQGFELKIKDGNENHVLNSDEEGKYSITIAKNPSATKPYVNAEDKEIQISITGENTTSIDDFVLTLDEDQEVANFNLRPKFTLKGPGNQTVKVKGEDENTIETVSSSYGNWEVVFDTTKVNLNNIRIISEAEGYYSKDSLISSLYFGVHDNIDMTLDKKFLYSWQGPTNAEKIQITGVGIDTLINVVENYYASRVYDSKDENKEVSIKGSAWGYQDLTTQTNTAGSHEISMQLNPNEFKLSGTISEDDVTMEFIVDDDTQTSQVSYNYSYSRQQVIDSIDIRVKAMKSWFDTIDTTLRVGPTDNEYNIVMKQNRWPFIFGGQGNAPIHIEDENGRELGIANPVNGVWSFEMDTTTNEFNIRMYTEETNYYNKDTTFVAYAGNNLGIDMSLYQKFLYKWMGVTTPGATVRINGTLIDTTFVTSTGNFESNVYDSKEANLSHNITSSLTGYITRDTTTTENGNHNLEMILVEESSPEKE